MTPRRRRALLALQGTLLLAVLLSLVALPRSAAGQADIPAAGCGPGEPAQECLRQGLRAAQTALRQGGDGAVAAQLARAVSLLRHTCTEGGLGEACYFAGRLGVISGSDSAVHIQRRGGKREAQKFVSDADSAATKLFRHGCLAPRPSGRACSSAGDSYSEGVRETGEQQFLTMAQSDSLRAAYMDSATAYYRRGCELRDATACSREGLSLVERRELGPGRMTIAEDRARAGCRGNSLSGCALEARFREERLLATPPDQRGAAWRAEADSVRRVYGNACGGRVLAACGYLGLAYAAGTLARANPALAERYLRQGCAGVETDTPLGVGFACTALGKRALSADSAAAIKHFETGCMLLDAEGCLELGRMAARRDTVNESVFHFLTACAGRNGEGCARAGRYHEERADTGQAKSLYARACELGNGAGCRYLAPAAGARGTPAAGREAGGAAALKYYRRSCDLEDGEGCTLLGDLFALRFSDGERADRLYARGCRLGSARGCWRVMLDARRRGDEVQEGASRASACRLDTAYCKRATESTDP